MAKTTITVQVDEELHDAFAEAAQARRRTPEELLRDLMREAVGQHAATGDYDTWFGREVEQGLREADEPSVPRIDDAEVRTSWRQVRTTLVNQ